LGFFNTIKADVVPVSGGVAVTYIFDEKRVIDEIDIIGNDRLREREVRGVINWREGTAFLPDEYNREREAIIGLYAEKGYPNTTVDINVAEIGAGRVRITANVLVSRNLVLEGLAQPAAPIIDVIMHREAGR